MLRRGLQVAAATVVAGVVTHRETRDASADHSTETVNAFTVDAHYVRADNPGGAGDAVYGATTSSSESAAGVWGYNRDAGPGTVGVSWAGVGVLGKGPIGVKGVSEAEGSGATYGQHTNNGPGVVGDGHGSTWAGVYGRNPNANGVEGTGRVGVFSTSSATGQGAVWGDHSGQGFGVVGDGSGATNASVIGRNGTWRKVSTTAN